MNNRTQFFDRCRDALMSRTSDEGIIEARSYLSRAGASLEYIYNAKIGITPDNKIVVPYVDEYGMLAHLSVLPTLPALRKALETQRNNRPPWLQEIYQVWESPFADDEVDDTETFPIVDPILLSGQIAVLYGPPGVGKSTLTANLVRSLITGKPLAGQMAVTDTWRVGYFNLELPAGQFNGWLDDLGIAGHENLRAMNLRGKAGSSLDVLNPARRQKMAADIEEMGLGVLVIDTLGTLASQLGLDVTSNTHMWSLMTALQTFQQEAGLTAIILLHHSIKSDAAEFMGAQAIKSTTDVMLSFTRAGSTRKLTVTKGRDVAVDSYVFGYDAKTRTLTTKEVQKAASVSPDIDRLREVLGGADKPLSQRAVRDATGWRQSKAQQVISAAVQEGSVAEVDGGFELVGA